MLIDCDVSLDAKTFEKTLKLLTVRRKSAVASVSIRPAPSGLRIEVVGKAFTAGADISATGRWWRSVKVPGPTLVRLADKFGRADLRLTYACGRLLLNGLIISATDAGITARA